MTHKQTGGILLGVSVVLLIFAIILFVVARRYHEDIVKTPGTSTTKYRVTLGFAITFLIGAVLLGGFGAVWFFKGDQIQSAGRNLWSSPRVGLPESSSA